MNILEFLKKPREQTLRGDALTRATSISTWKQGSNAGLCGVASLEALLSKPTFSATDVLRFRDARDKEEVRQAKHDYCNRAVARNGLCQRPLRDGLRSLTDWPEDESGPYNIRVKGLFVADKRLEDGSETEHGFAVVKPIRSEVIPNKLKPRQAVVFDADNPEGPITVIDSPAATIDYLNAHSANPSEAKLYLVVERKPSLLTRLRSLVKR